MVLQEPHSIIASPNYIQIRAFCKMTGFDQNQGIRYRLLEAFTRYSKDKM